MEQKFLITARVTKVVKMNDAPSGWKKVLITFDWLDENVNGLMMYVNASPSVKNLFALAKGWMKKESVKIKAEKTDPSTGPKVLFKTFIWAKKDQPQQVKIDDLLAGYETNDQLGVIA